MADARSLLRQQRAARRIDHPHALYTETGKLSCTICHETLRSDALWDGHVRSLGHRQRILAQQKARGVNDNAATSIPERRPKSTGGNKETLSDEAILAQIISGAGGQKRKHGKQEDDDDVTMADAEEGQGEFAAAGNNNTEGEYDGHDDDDENDSAEPRLHKRSKPSSNSGTIPPGPSSSTNGRTAVAPTSAGSPPDLVRRTSGTPSHGVELQIPSRPATPSASATSANSTPKATSASRGPLGPVLEGGSGEGSLKQAPRAAFATTTTTITNDDVALTGGRAPSSSTTIAGAPPATTTNNDDEDDEWAAFEAEVVKATGSAAPATTGTSGTTNNDAVITAQPMTAEQIAAQKAEDERQAKKTRADIEIEDDKEEATRALETEFEEMEELEARVRRLREKREALRRGSLGAAVDIGGGGGGNGDVQDKGPGTATEKSAIVNGSAGRDVQEATKDDKEDEDDEDDDDEDDEDDWAGFRFRA